MQFVCMSIFTYPMAVHAIVVGYRAGARDKIQIRKS